MPKGRHLADFLHRVLVSSKAFAADLTSAAIKMGDIASVGEITEELEKFVHGVES